MQARGDAPRCIYMGSFANTMWVPIRHPTVSSRVCLRDALARPGPHRGATGPTSSTFVCFEKSLNGLAASTNQFGRRVARKRGARHPLRRLCSRARLFGHTSQTLPTPDHIVVVSCAAGRLIVWRSVRLQGTLWIRTRCSPCFAGWQTPALHPPCTCPMTAAPWRFEATVLRPTCPRPETRCTVLSRRSMGVRCQRCLREWVHLVV